VSSISSQMSEGSAVDRAVFTGLLILGLIIIVNRRHRVTKNLRHCWPILLFMTYCLASLTWSDFPDVAFKRWIREIGNWVMILVIWTDPRPLTALTRLLARASYTLIPLSVLLAKYFMLGRNYGYWMGETTYTGVAEDKNTLGAICLLFGIVSVWHLLNLVSNRRHIMYRKRHVLVHIVIIAMVAYLLAIANSITALSCMVLTTCVLLAIRWRVVARSQVMVHLLVLVTVAIPLCIAILGAFPNALHALGRNSTLTDRTLIWSWVIRLMPNRWVGAGYGSFWLGHRLDVMITNVTHTWIPNQAHNGYLEIFINLGWVGVGLLMLVIVWGYLQLIRAWRQKRPASELMLAFFIIGVVSNISEASFFRNLVPVWLFFMIAITVPRLEEERFSTTRLIKSTHPDCKAARVTDQGAFANRLMTADSL
jgi:exopolysaccharide production protein ExoQ